MSALLSVALLFAGCRKQVPSDAAGVQDGSAEDTEFVPILPPPGNRVAVLFGYGYSDAHFVASTLAHLQEHFKVSDIHTIVLPLTYPSDFMVGSVGRISSLYKILDENQVCALILLGAPERTYAVLGKLRDGWGQSTGYPVISFFPQDDVLAMEAECDLVIDAVGEVESESELESEIAAADGKGSDPSARNIDDIPDILINALDYVLSQKIPPDRTNPAAAAAAYATEAANLMGTKWKSLPYVDTESGLHSVNHFIIEKIRETHE
jgi:hypothetical protein